MKRRLGTLVPIGFLVAACTRFTTGDDAPLGQTTQKLESSSERLTGADLPANHLVLTFDDSPVSQDVTGAISTFLSTRTKPIHATFFVDGSCVAATTLPNPICAAPTSDGITVLTKLQKDGHLIGNHTTTARDLVTDVPASQVVKELMETDAVIAPFVPWNRKVFRAPHGSWIGSGADGGNPDVVFDTLHGTAMDAYAGPIFWNIGGGPTTTTQASDSDCWKLGLTVQQCGDLYRQEIHAKGSGIVLLHDSLSTLGLVRYLIPLLETDGFTFDALDASPAVTTLLPACDSACRSCNGPAATDCTDCPAGQRLTGAGCIACLVCPTGTFTTAACTEADDTTCTPCPNGTFNAGPGSVGCTLCESCDDNDGCTSDQCSTTQGCTHTHIPGCSPSPPVEDAGGLVIDAGARDGAGPVIDQEANVAAEDGSDSASGCRTSRGRDARNGGLVVAIAVLVSVRRRRRPRPIPL